MKYAIIQAGGKQYCVSEGQEILIDRLRTKEKHHMFPDVLLLRTDDTTVVGTPFIPNTKVVGVVLGEEKGKKLHVSKFKAKVRYRKTIGFRPLYSRIRIDAIDTGEPKKEAPMKKAAVASEKKSKTKLRAKRVVKKT